MISTVTVSPQNKPDYKVVITQSLDFSYLLPFVNNRQVLVVTNSTLARLYLEKLTKALSYQCLVYEVCTLADGESHKSAESLNKIYQQLLQKKYTRSCVLIALGGGVIGDITGFAAATYQRGVNVLQVPTTLLSQVDSSVGGKTAINHPLGKNMIGAFFQPELVYTSTSLLKSLPQREFVSGMAEVVKYGCIIDADFFEWLEHHVIEINNKDNKVLSYLIAKSCELKAHVVSMDEQEKTGTRALLNLGHTFGHAIECCQSYQGLRHGEAVGVGIVMAAKLSRKLGCIDSSATKRITELLKSFNIPVGLPLGIQQVAFVEAMQRDKKNTTQGVIFILLDAIGQAKVDNSVSIEALNDFLSPFFSQ